MCVGGYIQEYLRNGSAGNGCSYMEGPMEPPKPPNLSLVPGKKGDHVQQNEWVNLPVPEMGQ